MDKFLILLKLLCSAFILLENVNGMVTSCLGYPPGTVKKKSTCKGLIEQPTCLLCNTSRSSKDVTWFVGDQVIADKGYNFDADHAGGLAVNGCPEFELYSLRLERPSKLNNDAVYYCQLSGRNVSYFLLNVHAVAVLRINSRKVSNDKLILEFNESTETFECVMSEAVPPLRLVWLHNNVVKRKMELNSSLIDITEFNLNMTFQNLKTDDTLTCLGEGPFILSRNISLKVSYLRSKNESRSSGGIDNYSESPNDGSRKYFWHNILIPTGLIISLMLILVAYILLKNHTKEPSFNMNHIPGDGLSAGFRNSISEPYSEITYLGERRNGNSGNQEEATISLISKVKNNGAYEYWSGTCIRNGVEEECFVKSLSSKATLQEANDFKILAKRLKGLEESHSIVRLLLVNTEQNPYSIVYEVMEYGTLRDFVMSRYQQPSTSEQGGETSILKTQVRELLTFAIDITNAMIFLHEKNFRHPVLSLKKVVLTSQCCCKLYDFYPCDMALLKIKEVFQKNHPPLPWMSPETIFLHEYSDNSDVWCYSTLLWELFSLGEITYAGKQNKEIEDCVRRGVLLSQPANCPEIVYSTMLLAWTKNSITRPSFQVIQTALEDVLKSVSEEETSEAEEYFSLEPRPPNVYI